MKMTTETFIKKALKLNPDYDYSLSVYLEREVPLKIICPTHGIFEQKPSIHLGDHSRCPTCAKEIIAIKNFERGKLKADKCAQEFLNKAVSIHGDKYDYHLVEYIHSGSKVKIICPIHGIFEQAPNTHLNGHGCVYCQKEIAISNLLSKNKDKNKKSKEEFISKALKLHGNYYNYSQVDYRTAVQKVKILCPLHGSFEMRPDHHLLSGTCPECSSTSAGEKYIKAYLEEMKIPFETQKTFPECKYIKVLRFDFWIPSLNLLIEYDGTQHFKPIGYFGGEKAFKQLQIRDQIKNKFCSEKQIRLLRISYLNRDIGAFLKGELKLNGRGTYD